MPHGTKSGGRKAGTPNRATAEVRELARAWGPAAIEKAARLAGLVLGDDGMPVEMAESEQTRLAAIALILDRAYGKSTPLLDDGDGPVQQRIEVTWLATGVPRAAPEQYPTDGSKVDGSRPLLREAHAVGGWVERCRWRAGGDRVTSEAPATANDGASRAGLRVKNGNLHCSHAVSRRPSPTAGDRPCHVWRLGIRWGGGRRPVPSYCNQSNYSLHGGWGGIRTPGTLAGTPVFKTGALNHSATHPC